MNTIKPRVWALILWLGTLPALSQAEVDYATEVSLDHRLFWESPIYPGQLQHNQSSLQIEPELRWQAQAVDVRINFSGFYRWDERDSQRSHGDIRELYVVYQADTWDLLVGINKVFWGVTESRHLVDVINQTDALEDIDQEDKLGQPMINLSTQLPWGEWSLFIMPRFRPLAFSGKNGRFRGPFAVDVDHAAYESNDANQHLDWALRYSHVLGNLDLGLAYFDGTSREARLSLDTIDSTIIPTYDLMTQTSTDIQYTGEAWLLKLESFYRQTRVDDFAASVIGFEYTLFQIFDTNADMGFLMEYLWDDRNDSAPITSFDRDVFLGGRYTLNDTQDTQILGGFIADTDHQHTFISLEAQRRLNDRCVMELALRMTVNKSPEDPLAFLANNDHLRLKLSWFF